jgi:hypothetical protein
MLDIYQLLKGCMRTCGCGKATRLRERNRKHDLTVRGKKHPLYPTWLAMTQRCENPGNDSYGDYGGRGIVVWNDWHDPQNFIDWIMANLGPKPKGLSLDRIDNDGDYEPGNVRWATASQQQRNKRQGDWVLERPGAPRLTITERRQLAAELSGRGISGREIAGVLGVSPAAVCHYLAAART